MPLDANEQYLLELINRARLDPLAELARYNAAVAAGIYDGNALSSLNDGLAPGTISAAALQPLAPNESLNSAAASHSLHMLNVDQFAHSGIGNGDPGSRATAAGYNWTFIGENISWSGTTGTVNQLAFLEQQHFGLFESSGHRANTHNGTFSEAGLGAEVGQFTAGNVWNASMLTELFGDRGSRFYLTGVTYNDLNGNRFYTPGEGLSKGVSVSGIGGGASSAAGGYSIEVTAGLRNVTLGSAFVSVNFTGQNVKLDLVNGNQVLSSASITAISGVGRLELLGNAALSATGAAGAETIVGNAGNNLLKGMAGADSIHGQHGNDHLWGGAGGDALIGGAGIDYARYDDANWGNLTIRLDSPAANVGAVAVGDTYSGIEGLVGGTGADTVVGNTGNNYLFGGFGNDNIYGLAGNDYLNGGAGADLFRFTTALNAATNVDRIADFAHGSDDIVLSRSIFAAIGATLDAGELRLGTAAVDANDFLIYNSANGQLFYDANGNTAGGQTLFATLAAGTVLDTGDFVMV